MPNLNRCPSSRTHIGKTYPGSIAISDQLNQLIPHLSFLDDKHEWMLELVRDLCNINSGTRNLAGLEQIKQRLAEEFSVLGGELRFVDVDPQTIVDDRGETIEQPLGQAIHITKHADANTKIMLCIHMDTVYAVDHPFQRCRMLDNGRLNGPGVVDAKGGLVVMLSALRLLEKSPLAGKIGWEVFINADEELGSPGSKRFIESRAPHSDWGLLFEPCLPDGTLVSWRKGTGSFTFVARGRAAHSGREFDKGRNALVAIARLMDQVDKLNVDPEVTFNVGKISGGGPLNIVPDLGIGRVNVRARTLDQQRRAERQLESLALAVNRQDGIAIEVSGQFSSPPKLLDARARVLQKRIEACGEALGQPVKWRGSGGASDGNKFAAAGLANIDTLGPRGGNIHSANEYLIPESLVPTAKFVGLILLSFANEEG